MTSVVIIGKNESESIYSMLSSLLEYPYERIWVLDRCTDNSEKLLKSLDETYIKTDDTLMGRHTSTARNLGLSKCDPMSDVLFLDGDRYIISGTLSKLGETGADIELLLLEDEHRNPISKYYDYSNFAGQLNNYVYSCGIFFKRNAINKFIGEQGELFNTTPDVMSEWGLEDTYGIGDFGYHLGLKFDWYKHCRLAGRFETTCLSNSASEKRFALREKLNVQWRPKIFNFLTIESELNARPCV